MTHQEILRCLGNIRYSGHALKEMLSEEFGEISEDEVVHALKNGRIIEQYPHDRPIPSCLVFGRTKSGRPLHVVCATIGEERRLVIITTYEPDPAKWEDFERRVPAERRASSEDKARRERSRQGH